MDDDWGLQAVVRGCSSAVASTGAAAASTNTTTTITSFMAHNDFFQPNNNNSFFFSPFGSSNNNSGQHQSSGQLFSLTDPLRARNHAAMEELHELYKPFFPKSQTSSSPNIISISSLNSSSSSDQRSGVVQTKQQPQNIVNPSTKQSHGASTIPRSKKRKNQLKKVCQVPAESLSSDIWAWRKYGQKPIKGSPYPRGYYRCSSSKGCLARKQVERNKSDPGMFIVTYTAEHNHPAPTHRNSLAGSTRQKPSSSAVSAVGDAGKYPSAGKSSSPATSVEEELTAAQAQSTTTESKEGQESSSLMMDDEEEDEFGFSDVAVSDDFFVGLEGLGSPATGDFFSDYFPSSFGLPWVASNAATAAGGS